MAVKGTLGSLAGLGVAVEDVRLENFHAILDAPRKAFGIVHPTQTIINPLLVIVSSFPLASTSTLFVLLPVVFSLIALESGCCFFLSLLPLFCLFAVSEYAFNLIPPSFLLG